MYRPKTTLEQWRMLQAVVDNGGYAQAAAALNKSQSSLNHAVAKLQDQLGVSLLEVKGRKAFLTPTGEVLLRRSRALTDTVETLEGLARNIECGWEPEIRLAVESIYPPAQLVALLAQFQPQSRGSRLQIYHSVITGTEELILNGSVDIAITSMIPRGFMGQSLCTVEMVPVVHRDHHLATIGRPVSGEELAQELQLVIRDTAAKPRELGGWLRAENRWTFGHFQDALQVVKAGMGFLWVPRHLVEEELEAGCLKVVRLRDGGSRSAVLNLVLPDPDQAGPGTHLLAELIRGLHNLPLNE
ncbi:LysR family transcriptional regulator [Gallaecimonas kandeliae]|uniref:LysR family transcriptional regulator n=1 Tax=Gallaecimonas kandeliae TaxID=3029055 RepID=UPI002647D9CD|nr:LysR family transcriptional regulator [Gallaecimonas kandeliae]WKE64501.1 LysR family transcriptional regulator [Gallaecimonas kandeliae]